MQPAAQVLQHGEDLGTTEQNVDAEEHKPAHGKIIGSTVIARSRWPG